MTDTIPDPHDATDDTDTSDLIANRSQFSHTLASAGYSGVLVLSRERLHDLADETRLAIIDALRDGPLSKADLATTVGVSEDELADHLATLFELSITTTDGDDVALAHRYVVVEPLYYDTDTQE